MRKLIPLFAATFLFTGMALLSVAADEKTWTGEGVCAKCALKQTKTCQNALQVEQDGKTVTYYLVPQDKKFHKNICTANKKIKVTGTVEKDATADAPGEIKASKIELVGE
ncbi:MAG: hypothetical protein NVSMB14_18120 [Isosphaeraceae bacterium]